MCYPIIPLFDDVYLFSFIITECSILASSKQRCSLRKAIATDKAKLQKVIEKYCSVQQCLQPEARILVVEEDILSGQFPWCTLTGTYGLHIIFSHGYC